MKSLQRKRQREDESHEIQQYQTAFAEVCVLSNRPEGNLLGIKSDDFV